MKTTAKILLAAVLVCVAPQTTAKFDPLEPLIWRANRVVELDKTQLKCLTQNIYYEARGEPVEGQIAVAQVTLNRVLDGRWGSTVCDVVYHKHRGVCHFSWVCIKHLSKPKQQHWQQAETIAYRTAKVLYTDVQYKYKTATHFHNNTVKPSWSRKLQPVKQVGNHIFYEL